jgi:ATP-dependent Clp protease ATP-binding subunit ClpA
VILIMTSNAGSREMAQKLIGIGRDDAKEQGARGKHAVERLFSPEFRNRLDAIVTFDSLSPAAMETIVEKFVLELESQLRERKVAITLQPDARAWLAQKGFDPRMGARPLARVIQSEVRDRLTDEILFGALEHGGEVTLSVVEEVLHFSFAPLPPTEGTDPSDGAAAPAAPGADAPGPSKPEP